MKFESGKIKNKDKDMPACPLLDDNGVDDDHPCDELIGEPVMIESACPIAVQVCDSHLMMMFQV